MIIVTVYQKHGTLRYAEVFIFKMLDTSKKARQFAFGFLYTKSLTLCFTRFFMEFLKLAEGGGHFYEQKTMHFALRFYMQKTMHFPLRFYAVRMMEMPHFRHHT